MHTTTTALQLSLGCKNAILSTCGYAPYVRLLKNDDDDFFLRDSPHLRFMSEQQLPIIYLDARY